MPAFTIAVANDGDLPACLALLPMLAMPQVRVWTVRDPDGRLLGAGGLLWRAWGEPAGFPAWVTVLPDCRRAGIGRALVATLGSAALGEARGLWVAEPLSEAGEAAAFAEATGFTVRRKQLFFDCNAEAFLAAIIPIVTLLRKRKRIPEAARVVPLAEAPLHAVAQLVAREFRTSPFNTEALLTEAHAAPDSFTVAVHVGLSQAVMVGDQLAGALLVQRFPDRARAAIFANIVAPAWRHGWVNALLLGETTRVNIEAGARRFTFDCTDDITDTINLARRGGADHLRTSARWRLALED